MALNGLCAAMCIAAAAVSSPSHAGEAKMGVVDLRRALGETDEGRAALGSLKQLFDKKQKELDERQDALRAAIGDLEKKRTLLSADVLRAKEAELQSKAKELQELLVRNQQSLQEKQSELLDRLIGRMHAIIETIAAREELSIVLDRSQAPVVVFAKRHLDLTDELVRRFNAGDSKPQNPATRPGSKPARP